MIVMKFGGSSLESPAALERVVSIVNSFADQSPVVVVSAMGKTTDRLLRIGKLAAESKSNEAHAELKSLQRFHLDQIAGVNPAARSIAAHFEEAAPLVNQIAASNRLSPCASDALLSYGERLSSLIVASALGAIHLLAERLILTDASHTNASPLLWETYAKLRRAIPNESSRQIAVLGGFIGATESGTPTTLGRGGSDFTAALVGAAISAEEIQIWTDVNGMLSCDPRISSGGRCLRNISYAEAFEMAEWGAKVLHPATIAPAVRLRIPVSIRNSSNPIHAGTRIDIQPGLHKGLVKSIACMKDLALLRIHTTDRAQVESIFKQTGTHFYPMNSRNALEFAVADPSRIIDALSQMAKVDIETGLSVVSLIGEGIDQNQGLLSHAKKTLASRSIAFHSLGSAPMRLSFVVATQELQLSTESLHDEFIKFQDDGPYYHDFETNRKRASPLRPLRTLSGLCAEVFDVHAFSQKSHHP